MLFLNIKMYFFLETSLRNLDSPWYQCFIFKINKFFFFDIRGSI